MFLAFALSDIIKVPFGYLMDWLYQFTNNYGLALILFAVLVKVILFPVQAKSKKSMMKMSRLTPKMQAIQAKYAGDQQKQNEAVQALYREEGVSFGGGCLWSFVPLLILIPLYAVVRQPIVYMLHESADVAAKIVEIVKDGVPAAFGKNTYYDEMVAARYVPEFVDAIKAALPTVSEKTLLGINFDFLGVDMGSIPTINVFSEAWAWDWAHIGGALIPLLSAGSQVLMMKISQDMNNSVVTNEKGIQDKEAAKNSQSAQTGKMMMWTMPIMMLWIGFTVPVVLSLYWMVQGLVSVVQDVYLTKHYRKIYDEEDAIKLQKALEEDRIEAERERVRAERRAANPDGQTQNTSKKKIQKQLREQEAAEKAANAKEYAAKKGIVEEEDESASCMSGIPSRPYCKGRNYDPNSYSNQED